VEILNEIGHEIAAEPWNMVVEVAQFLILIAVIWIVALGFGKRKGFVTNMLSERQLRIQAQLAEAQGANARLDAAELAAGERERAAAEEAERLLSEATDGAARSAQQVRAESDSEAARIVDRARTALDNERAQMQADLREQLVELVSQASRSIMNEKLTVAEQRSRIEETIVAGVATAGKANSASERVPAAAAVVAPAASGEGS
jgi:F-type H+-transporting ATPase subunit b